MRKTGARTLILRVCGVEVEYVGEAKRSGANNINWVGHPEYNEELLDWLDAHPVEREIILLSKPGTRGSLSKQECFDRLAVVFCASEGDERSKLDPARARTLLQSHFSNLEVKYKKVLDAIGPVASQKRYKDIADGSDIHIALIQATERFAIWQRLHKHWRTSPHHNHYYQKRVRPTSGPSGSGSGLMADLESRVKRRTDDLEEAPPPKRSKATFQEGSSIRREGQSSDIKRTGQADSKNGLTSDQSHELQLANIRLEQLKIELELKRTSAEMEQRNQEFQLRVLNLGMNN